MYLGIRRNEQQSEGEIVWSPCLTQVDFMYQRGKLLAVKRLAMKPTPAKQRISRDFVALPNSKSLHNL